MDLTAVVGLRSQERSNCPVPALSQEMLFIAAAASKWQVGKRLEPLMGQLEVGAARTRTGRGSTGGRL